MAKTPVDDKKHGEQVEMTEHAAPRDSLSGEVELPEEHEHTMNLQVWLACLALGLSYSTAIQQFSCTATIVKHIDIALGPTTYFNWIISGHNITVALILPLAGGLSDIFGRRWFFIAGCTFSLIGTIIALAAKNIPMMIAGMVLKGIGSGSQQLSIAAIAEIIPKKHRGTAQAVLDLVALPWTVFGALIGNSMVKYYTLSFRVNFIIGVILNIMTMVSIYLWYHPGPGSLPPGVSKMKAFRSLDWIGIFLLACGIVLTLAGIAFGGTLFPWRSAGVIATITCGFLSFIALGLWEWKGTSNPFFAPELFQGDASRFPLFLVLMFVGGMSLYAASAFWTQQCQAMFFSDPTKIGVSAIPSGIGASIGGFLGGILLGKGKLFGAKNLLLYGTGLKMVGDGIFTSITPDRFALALVAGTVAMLGMGILLVGTIVLVQLTCSDKHIGLASLILSSARAIGGSLAVTCYTSIMQNTVKTDAKKRVGNAVLPMGLPGESLVPLVETLIGGRAKKALAIKGMTQPILDKAQSVIKWSWALAFQRIFYAAIVFTTIAFIASLFVKDVSKNMTDTVAVTLQNDHSKAEKKVVES